MNSLSWFLYVAGVVGQLGALFMVFGVIMSAAGAIGLDAARLPLRAVRPSMGSS